MVVDLPNDLAADEPEVIEVASNCCASKSLLVDVGDEGPENGDEAAADGLVLVVARPARWPALHELGRFLSCWLTLLSEAAIGAGLVLLQRVAGDTSASRGYWISGHLINTFLCSRLSSSPLVS